QNCMIELPEHGPLPATSAQCALLTPRHYCPTEKYCSPEGTLAVFLLPILAILSYMTRSQRLGASPPASIQLARAIRQRSCLTERSWLQGALAGPASLAVQSYTVHIAPLRWTLMATAELTLQSIVTVAGTFHAPQLTGR